MKAFTVIIWCFFAALSGIAQQHDSTSDSCDFYIPNTLTPDCDYYPCDVLSVAFGCPYISFHIQIYNRWGEMLFESTDEKNRWDSTYNGELVEDGTYLWRLKVKFESGQLINQSGHIYVLK